MLSFKIQRDELYTHNQGNLTQLISIQLSCDLQFKMTVTSIDLETATLSAPQSIILNLTKQLKFMKIQYKKLKSQHESISCISNHDIDTDNNNGDALVEIDKFLNKELKDEYSGSLSSDIIQFEYKLMMERNQYEYQIEMNNTKITMLEEQCTSLLHDINNKDYCIKQIKLKHELLNQEYALTIHEMDNQLKHQSYINDNNTESIDDTKTDTFTFDIAIQTDVLLQTQHVIEDNFKQEMDSVCIQTELLAKDVLTIENFDHLMRLQNDEQIISPACIIKSPVRRPLIISPPHNTLELEFDLMKTRATLDEEGDKDRLKDCNTKRIKKQFVFGDELFSRTQMRMEKRKQYNKLKNQRMNKSLRKLRMDQSKTNFFRCTKVTKS